MDSFDDLNINTFLADIKTSFFVLGFLPILGFFSLIEKVPNLEILTFLCLIKLFKISSKNSSSKFSVIFFEYPICIYIEFIISFFVKLFLILI